MDVLKKKALLICILQAMHLFPANPQ